MLDGHFRTMWTLGRGKASFQAARNSIVYIYTYISTLYILDVINDMI